MDLMYRATDKAAWDAYAASVNLTVDGMPSGCYIDTIGPIVTTPAVIDPETGDVVTHAVVDEHFHVNVRLTQIAGPAPDPLPPDYVQQGHDPAVLAQGGPGVEWLDPATVLNPARIWAGGMSYWVPVVEEA
jgi:hypothetical protein